jgi:hypothetical protein
VDSNTANPAGNPTVKGFEVPVEQTGEFQRFEDLASKLMKVPKTELDEKLKSSS